MRTPGWKVLPLEGKWAASWSVDGEEEILAVTGMSSELAAIRFVATVMTMMAKAGQDETMQMLEQCIAQGRPS